MVTVDDDYYYYLLHNEKGLCNHCFYLPVFTPTYTPIPIDENLVFISINNGLIQLTKVCTKLRFLSILHISNLFELNVFGSFGPPLGFVLKPSFFFRDHVCTPSTKQYTPPHTISSAIFFIAIK